MKKILYSILLMIFILLPSIVSAEGYIYVSPSSLTIEQGSSKTFTISAYNTIGDVSIKSNNSAIASVSSGEWGTGMVDEKQTKTGTITVKGVSVGTTTITLVIDAATFDGDDLAGQTKTITVNVVAKPAQSSNSNNNNNNNNPADNLSKNNNIKSLTVEGYELVKVNNNNYSLTVTNDVTSINVKATAEDSKAKITGTGTHKLQVGENNIELIITSESGAKNKINIKVTRKDGYYLEDLDSVLKNSELKDVDIIINDDSKISKEDISKIKDSKKIIRLNYYDETKKLIYTWTIDGTKIQNTDNFLTTITYESKYTKEISKLSNYADGIYINIQHTENFPEGTKVKLYVGDKYEEDSIVNVYYYNKEDNKLELVKNDLSVEDKYIELNIDKGSEYFITMSNINTIEKSNSTSSFNIFLIISIIEFILILILLIIYFIKIKSILKK